MATATAVSRDRIEGNRKVTVTDVLVGAVYATGGYAVTAADLGLNTVDYTLCSIKTSATTIVNATYDVATGKLKLWAAGAEVAGSAAVSLAVITVVAFGQ